MSDALNSLVDELDELIGDGELEEAQEKLAQAMEEHNRASALLVLEAQILLELEQYDVLIAATDKSLKEVDDPEERGSLLTARAYAYFYLDQVDEARKTFNQAVKSDPELNAAIIGRAMVHEHMKFYNAAIIDCDRALELDDQESQPWAIRGTIHLRFGRLEPALKDLEFAHESDPDDEEVLLNLSRLYALQQNNSAAMDLLSRLLDNGEDPDYLAPGALLRSQLSVALGSWEAGVEDAERAIALFPKEPWGYLQAAACILTAGAEPGKAVELLKQAEDTVDSVYDIPDIFALRATAYDQLGKPEKGKEILEKAEGAARLPGYIYGYVNPAGNVPINPGRPIDVRALMDDLFGEAKLAPKGYEDLLRQVVDRIPELIKEHPNVGQLAIELPEAPGMVGGKRQLMIQVGNKAQAPQPQA